MGKQLIMLSSVTVAMKGKEYLYKKGIHSEVEKTPKKENPAGCGFSLYVPGNADEAEKLLIDGGFRVIGRTDRVI